VQCAKSLLIQLAGLRAFEQRVRLLERLNKRLGDDQYPAFIKILSVVGESEDLAAKRLMADTLAYAMQQGVLPSGTLTSWGIPSSWAAVAPAAVSFFRLVPRRSLDPIEYLCAWYCQGTDRQPLRDEIYQAILTSLLRLFNASRDAAQTYRAKMMSDIETHPEGTFTEGTRSQIAALVQEWASNSDPQAIACCMVRPRGNSLSAADAQRGLLYIPSR